MDVEEAPGSDENLVDSERHGDEPGDGTKESQDMDVDSSVDDEHNDNDGRSPDIPDSSLHANGVAQHHVPESKGANANVDNANADNANNANADNANNADNVNGDNVNDTNNINGNTINGNNVGNVDNVNNVNGDNVNNVNSDNGDNAGNVDNANANNDNGNNASNVNNVDGDNDGDPTSNPHPRINDNNGASSDGTDHNLSTNDHHGETNNDSNHDSSINDNDNDPVGSANDSSISGNEDAPNNGAREPSTVPINPNNPGDGDKSSHNPHNGPNDDSSNDQNNDSNNGAENDLDKGTEATNHDGNGAELVNTDPNSILSTSPSLPSSPPPPPTELGPDHWFIKAFNSIAAVDLGPEYNEILRLFIALESAYGFRKGSRTDVVSPHGRPALLDKWIGNGRWRVKTPVVDKVERYAPSWLSWWNSLQPEWRETDGDGNKTGKGTYGTDWGTLRAPGQNGMLSVIASLYWWGCAVQDASEDRRVRWRGAVFDVIWVLQGLISSAISRTE